VIFTPTPLANAFVIGLEPHADERGGFARAFCAKEFAEQGLVTEYVQANLSTNTQAGTVRGMHYQRHPYSEVKLVRCVVGIIYDVIVDLRQDSPTYLQWFGAELSQDNGLMMYVPQGFAHGYQALTAGATAHYMVSAYYAPDAEGGLRYDDPALNINWPIPVTDVSPKDARWPLVDEVSGSR
jgi:dTDP-4-dehydrorhamnose 3,5-epimerase